MKKSNYNDNVFINCPLDAEYKPILDAIVFTIFDCGFVARCALEEDDASQFRLEKIYGIISECRYGIHDISRTQLDKNTGLPRFNMPLELGIFLGAKKFGKGNQRKKKALILDTKPYRYRKFISDISGQDIKAHENHPNKAIKIVRDWLRSASRRVTLPGGHVICERYNQFINDLPEMCKWTELDPNSLIFNDYVSLVAAWLEEQAKIGG